MKNKTLRETARANGQATFIPTKPCRHGHLAYRLTSSGSCSECKRISGAKFRAGDIEAVRAAERARAKAHYYKLTQPQLDEIKKRRRDRYADSEAVREKEKDRVKKYVSENREAFNKYQREYVAKNREAIRSRGRRLHAENPEKYRVYKRNRRARTIAAGGSHTKEEITALYDRQQGCCANCRKNLEGKYHADHIYALVNGGNNSICNIQLLCPPCNQRKGASDPIEWAKKHGRLI